MLFSHMQLGVVPAGAAGGARAPMPGTSTLELGPGIDGTTTVDGKLIYVQGRWCVRTTADVPSGTFGPQITAEYVRDVMHVPELMLGPFRVPWQELPLVQQGGYHEMPAFWLTDPTTAPPSLVQVGKNLLKDWGDPHFSVTGFSAGDVMQDPARAATDWWPNCPAALASYQAWLAALGIGQHSYYYNMLPMRAPTKFYEDVYKGTAAVGGAGLVDKFGYPIVPLTSFTHPMDGRKWGVYALLTTNLIGSTVNGLVQHLSDNGGCPVSTNTSNGSGLGSLQLQYWVAPIDSVTNFLQNRLQDSSTIAGIVAFIDSIANVVVEIANWIGGLAGLLACNVVNSSLCRSPKDPQTEAACVASAALCSSSSPGGLLNCGDPKNAALPACQPKLPWYKQWYVIVPVVGLGFLAILSLSKPKPSTRPAT